MLIIIQSHSSPIILVMIRINYKLNSWSHKSAVNLLCIMGSYSLDGIANTYTSSCAKLQTHMDWLCCIPFLSRLTEIKSKCRLLHRWICKERRAPTQAETNILWSVFVHTKIHSNSNRTAILSEPQEALVWWSELNDSDWVSCTRILKGALLNVCAVGLNFKKCLLISLVFSSYLQNDIFVWGNICNLKKFL